MVTDPMVVHQFFPNSASLLFLQVETFNPWRTLFIVAIALLWLFCFRLLLPRDKRKAELRSLEKRKNTASFTEKRENPRILYPMFVLYRVLGSENPSSTLHVSNARNLSLNGLLLEVKQDLPIGTKLELKLTLTRDIGPLMIQGSVCRKEWLGSLGIFALGIAFEITQPEDRQKVADFIEREQRKELQV